MKPEMPHQIWRTLGSKLHGWTGQPLSLTWNADYLLVLLPFSFLLVRSFHYLPDYCVTRNDTQFFVQKNHPQDKQPFIPPLPKPVFRTKYIASQNVLSGILSGAHRRNKIGGENRTFLFYWAFAFHEYQQLLVFPMLCKHIFPFIIWNSGNCEQQNWGVKDTQPVILLLDFM